MARVPVRIGPGRLDPALAEAFPWRCAMHHAAGEEQCVKRCCGACYFLVPGEGCQLGGLRPVRCKTYPLIPMKDKVLVHVKCPDAEHFRERLDAGDPRARALLDVAIAMSDLIHEGADDNSEEIRWMMEYVDGGFRGPILWRRKKR